MLMSVFACVCAYTRACMHTQRPEKGVGFPQAGLIGGCEMFSIDARGIKLRSSGNHLLSPSFTYAFYYLSPF